MPCISGTYDADTGVLLQAGLLPGGTTEPAHRQAAASGDGQTRITVATAQTLLDTGASQTSISPRLAAQVALEPIGKIPIQSATGLMSVNTYYVDIVLRFGPQSIVVPNLNACEFDSGQAPFQILIGRDIICKGVLTMDFAGRFTFSI